MQGAVGQRAEAHGEVDPLADGVDIAVAEVQVDADLRVLLHELRKDRLDVLATEVLRGAEADRPAKGVGAQANAGVQLVGVCQQAMRAIDQQAAFIREVDRAGGALEQAGAVKTLQLRQPFRHRGRR